MKLFRRHYSLDEVDKILNELSNEESDWASLKNGKFSEKIKERLEKTPKITQPQLRIFVAFSLVITGHYIILFQQALAMVIYVTVVAFFFIGISTAIVHSILEVFEECSAKKNGEK